MGEKSRKQESELLRIENLTVSFSQYEGNTAEKTDLTVISDLNVTVREGEIVAVVGSSGSGKSLLAHAVFGLLPQNASVRGKICYRGEVLDRKGIEKLRGQKMALVPQGGNYLDPLMKVGRQITNGRRDAASTAKMRELCRRYGLEESVEGLYPFELSGGMARRVLLMTALMSQPELIIADEPTPGMELELAMLAMQDFRSLADEGKGILLITHDLELALEAADRIVVFYAGTTIEEANVSDFQREVLLRHPYTRALYRAMPKHGFQPFPGTQPYVKDMPKGCPFAPRCPQRMGTCGGEIPVVPVRGGSVRCVRYLKGAGMEMS